MNHKLCLAIRVVAGVVIALGIRVSIPRPHVNADQGIVAHVIPAVGSFGTHWLVDNKSGLRTEDQVFLLSSREKEGVIALRFCGQEEGFRLIVDLLIDDTKSPLQPTVHATVTRTSDMSGNVAFTELTGSVNIVVPAWGERLEWRRDAPVMVNFSLHWTHGGTQDCVHGEFLVPSVER